MSDDKTMDKKWPRLFTCPTTGEVLKTSVLGGDLFNPVMSTLKEIQSSWDGCPDCDMKGECAAPVEYVPQEQVAKLEKEKALYHRYAGFLRSCILSGEFTKMTLEEFAKREGAER